jgi:hypothetical protein
MDEERSQLATTIAVRKKRWKEIILSSIDLHFTWRAMSFTAIYPNVKAGPRVLPDPG